MKSNFPDRARSYTVGDYKSCPRKKGKILVQSSRINESETENEPELFNSAEEN